MHIVGVQSWVYGYLAVHIRTCIQMHVRAYSHTLEVRAHFVHTCTHTLKHALTCSRMYTHTEGPEDFVVSVEVNPQPGLSTEKPVGTARMLREAGETLF
jgi:hypothetical protein